MHRIALSLYIPTLNESTNDRYPSPIGEPNLKDRCDRWKNLSSLSTTPYFHVESYHYPPLEKLDIHRRLTFWIAFTPDPLFGHQVALFQVALSYYAPVFNESTNDRYLSLIGESNPKDRLDRWENLSSLNTTTYFHVEPMWDCNHCPPLEKLNVVRIQLTLWIDFTPDPLSGTR